MERDPDDRPGGVDAFDAIVSGWRREGRVPEWPDETAASGPPDTRPAAPDPTDDGTRPPVRSPGTAGPDDEHYVPPEPPPLPRLGPPALVGLVLLALGIVLVTVPGWIGVPDIYGLPLGLLTLAAGLGWLVLRLWPAPPPSDDDDGAVV